MSLSHTAAINQFCFAKVSRHKESFDLSEMSLKSLNIEYTVS